MAEDLGSWQRQARDFWNSDDRARAMESIAPDWTGESTGAGPWWEERNWQEALLRHVPLRQDWAALEIGCGMGRLMRQLAPRFRKIDGVDISQEMIRYSKEFLAGLATVETRLGNGYDLSGFEDGAYAFAYSIVTFQHIHSVAVVSSYLAEVFRVLEPGGYFALQVKTAPRPGLRDRIAGLLGLRSARSTASRRWKAGVAIDFAGNTYRPHELRELVEAAGMRVVASEEGLLHPSWLWVTARRPGPDRE